MQRSATYFLTLIITLSALHASEDQRSPETVKQEVHNILKNITIDNKLFREHTGHDSAYYRRVSKSQHPRATIIGCSDSRVHTSNFDSTPLGDVFFIRNIGNQIEPCHGSVEYGVRHLNTPLLLILGHSKCGAVTAVTEGTEHLEPVIQLELQTMQLTHHSRHPTDQQIAENITENVHNQVNKALSYYADLIEKRLLWVVGAVYDFTPQGQGQLKIVQVNGSSDRETIASFLADVEEYGDYLNDPGREQ